MRKLFEITVHTVSDHEIGSLFSGRDNTPRSFLSLAPMTFFVGDGEDVRFFDGEGSIVF
jgi:hypothetical protein